jgi:hypothetical protein
MATVSLESPRGNGKHKFTPEESSLGGRLRGRNELKILKFTYKKELELEWARTVHALVTNPAVAGTIAYGIVDGFDALAKLANASKKAPNSLNPIDVFTKTFQTGLQNTLGPLGSLIGGGLTGANLVGNDLLKGAILIYIATGGNITGVLTTAGAGLAAVK